MSPKELMSRRKRAIDFFEGIAPEHRAEAEAMYQAFKDRMIVELEVSGSVVEGVVYGTLCERD